MGRTALLLVLAAGMVGGPILANFAWNGGVHVTPEQAAAHFALIAEGVTHHHHRVSSGQSAGAIAYEGAIVQDGPSGLMFGSALAQATPASASTCIAFMSCPVIVPDATPGEQADIILSTPPPKPN